MSSNQGCSPGGLQPPCLINRRFKGAQPPLNDKVVEIVLNLFYLAQDLQTYVNVSSQWKIIAIAWHTFGAQWNFKE